MNIFDTADIQKQIAEEQNKWLEEPEKKEEVVEEEEVKELEEEVEEEEKPDEGEKEEEEERPTTGEGWKKLREKKKAAQAEAEAQRKIAEEKDKQLMEMRERLARLEGREEARVKPEVKEVDNDPEPDKELFADEHRDWRVRQLEKRTEQAEQKAAQAEALAKIEGTRRGLNMLEKEYIKNNKIDDYENAMEHIKTVERNLIKLRYPSASDTAIDSHLEAQRIKLAEESFSAGVNPGEHFYKMAQALGYKKAKEKVNDKPNIEALNRNMEKNASLIGASSADKTGGIPAEKLVKMSIADLLNAENSKKLADEIRRQEAKWMAGS